MELKRCKNGHVYDPSVTDECPECAAMRGHTVPLGGRSPDWTDIEPGPDRTVASNTAPNDGKTDNYRAPVNHWADTDDYKTAGKYSDAYSPTMPADYARESSAVRPVTGWLVCISGPGKGQDYRLHADMNYIGRSKNNDVVLAGDPTVSRERHALIAYDTRGKLFFFAPANGASLVRQNGRPVLSTVELAAGDRLEIGSGVYQFVPLCGESFQWESV